MKTAILGWGSLINKPGDMLLEGKWEPDGPVLKIEFSRISADGRLTLVLDSQHGTDVKTMYARSGRIQLEDAVCDLMIREGTSRNKIGICSKENTANAPVDHPSIRQWLDRSNFDAVIWTNLESNFSNKREVNFSVENAFRYLESLPPVCKENARDYIRKAPEPTQTELRRYLYSKGWL